MGWISLLSLVACAFSLWAALRGHIEAQTADQLLPVATRIAGCQHEEFEDVTSPVYPGEVVARICTNPQCFKQLPADFEYKTLTEVIESGDLGRTPLLLGAALRRTEDTFPPYGPKPTKGQRWHDSKTGQTAVWNGSAWQVEEYRHAGTGLGRGIYEPPGSGWVYS